MVVLNSTIRDVVLRYLESKYNKKDLEDHDGVHALITDDKGRILMMDHVKFGFWTIPIGKVEKNETPEEALKTELKEELDITPTSYKKMGTFKKQYTREGKQVIVVAHLFKVNHYTGKLKNNEPDKHRSIKFMTKKEIGGLNLSDATKFALKHI